MIYKNLFFITTECNCKRSFFRTMQFLDRKKAEDFSSAFFMDIFQDFARYERLLK